MIGRVLPAVAICAALSWALMPNPAQAESVEIDSDLIDSCLASGGDASCIGVAIDPCIVALGGFSTLSHQSCTAAELGWWDDYLNRMYRAAQANSRRIDAEAADYGTPERPSDVDALRSMERAWIALRDATCDYEELQWWGGTGASGAYLECMLRLTGTQALYLRDLPGDG